MTTLDDLKENERGIIVKVNSVPKLKKRLIDMGIAPGKVITFKSKAPLGDPCLYTVMNSRYGIRREDARNIIVEKIKK